MAVPIEYPGPDRTSEPATHLQEPDVDDAVEALYAADLRDDGYVMNLTRVWAHDPATQPALFELVGAAARLAGLDLRERGLLVTAMAATLGDAYCSLAWGARLAEEVGPASVASVLTGADDPDLDARGLALVRWARVVTRDPNSTTVADVDALRAAGFDDQQVFGLTLFVALRQAFSTVNDALGARPDRQLVEAAPEDVRAAVTFGRPPATSSSQATTGPLSPRR
ncbi:carboxymuconolactone decarboxylase family protein [Terracoccus luteus]|uniref:Putative peroxidase-related enzyme n=1 Tax=Terracoccus luteus TaxID=53356 RepID=A0A495Y0Z5_9MICO|nr:hypothetical protein [Terracoccus luteus]MBB2986051.1 putative peroxidase-related enzyme [Terracoccus luteus]MCP2171703.1 putative peroxidase-related enzyme [Terracoccus luteus]RKT78814.1 putative peroxidase-related enzyme [Terracoccus luteus]